MKNPVKKIVDGQTHIRTVVNNDWVPPKYKKNFNPDPVRLQLYRDTLKTYERTQALYRKSKRDPVQHSMKRVEALMKSAETNLKSAWRMMLEKAS